MRRFHAVVARLPWLQTLRTCRPDTMTHPDLDNHMARTAQAVADSTRHSADVDQQLADLGRQVAERWLDCTHPY